MGKSVLIVDDNYICVEGISTSISWADFGIEHIYKAYDGSTALELIRRESINIIISDISMPGLSGLELSEQVMSINPAIKIILISAYDKFEYAKKAVRLGAYDYVEKPLDYDYLKQILTNLMTEMEEEQKHRVLLKKSIPALQEQFFRSLIQSNIREQRETLKLYASYLNLQFDCHYYMAFHISAEDPLFLKQKLGIEEYYVRLMNFEKSIHTAVAGFPLNYVIRDLTGFICIIGDNSETTSEFKQKILSELNRITEQYQERFEFVIGLGKISSSPFSLSVSYAQAQKALEYRFLFPSQNILEASAIPGFDPKLILNQENNEDKLIELLCKNNLEGIRDWIAEFTNALQENMVSRDIVLMKLYSIAIRILKFSCEINIYNEDLKQKIVTVFSQNAHYNNIDAIADWLLEICTSICTSLQDSVSHYHSSLCEAAVSYIRQNYPDSNLSLNAIAEHVQITPAYLSTLFKKYRNQNINNYITDVRINAACLLLKNTSESLKTISMQVGYANQYYFSSVFKKKMGMTPSTYREETEL